MRPNDIPEQIPPQVDRALLARFVAGETSPADVAVVERWLADDSAHEVELAELRRIWTRAGVLPSEARLDGLWRDLQQRMHEEASAERDRPALHLLPRRRSRMRPWVVGALAAAGIAAVAVGIAHTSGWMTPGAVRSHSPEWVYRTARGQRGMVVELADGSRVQLGADSKISVRLYDGGRREVHLEGEAMFDVIHDERRPFLVYARNAVTEDLGTRFGVRAYTSDTSVRVVVVSGKVALRPVRAGAMAEAGRGNVLTARDVGELGGTGEVFVRRDVEPDTYLAWTSGRIVFRETSLTDVVASLERWYDVDITVADSAVASRRLTLDLAAPSLDVVLDAMAVPLGLRYEHAGRHVTLHR